MSAANTSTVSTVSWTTTLTSFKSQLKSQNIGLWKRNSINGLSSPSFTIWINDWDLKYISKQLKKLNIKEPITTLNVGEPKFDTTLNILTKYSNSLSLYDSFTESWMERTANVKIKSYALDKNTFTTDIQKSYLNEMTKYCQWTKKYDELNAESKAKIVEKELQLLRNSITDNDIILHGL